MERKRILLIVAIITATVAVAILITLAVELTPHATSVRLYEDSYEVKASSVKTGRGVMVLEYKNIPYATAKRFEYPDVCSKTVECKKPEYDVVVSCLQFDFTTWSLSGREDCLYLTVKAPKTNGSLPVLVWIHGGGLAFGHSEEWSPQPDFVADVNAVIVNINYRLGFLGFLSAKVLKDKKLNTFGNYGHADQIAALQWVQDNIKLFGGDPDKVTVMGESAGGTSLLALLTSPLANNLFRKIIPLSPALQWSATSEEANLLPETTDVIKAIGCSDADDIALCLRTAPSNAFVPVNQDLDRGLGYFKFPRQKKESNDKVYLTVVDGVIVQKAPVDYDSVTFKPRIPVKVFLSNTAQECTSDSPLTNFTSFKNALIKNLEAFEANTGTIHFNGDSADITADKIIKAYNVPDKETEAFYSVTYDTIVTDIKSTCPGNYLANIIKSNANIDMYRIIFKWSDHLRESFYHALDIIIGFQAIPMFEKRGTLQREFRQMIKEIVHDKISSAWEQYPDGVAYLSDKGREYNDQIPQDSKCQMWKTFKMDHQYGWHN